MSILMRNVVPIDLRLFVENVIKRNILTLHSEKVEEKMVLGTLQTGQGFSHLDAFIAILGLSCFGDGKFKKMERKVGKVIEAVATESCEKWREEEKTIENDRPNGKLKGAYDTSWSKRGGERSPFTKLWQSCSNPHPKIGPTAIFAFYSLNYSLAARLQDNSRPKSPTKVETKRKLQQFTVSG